MSGPGDRLLALLRGEGRELGCPSEDEWPLLLGLSAQWQCGALTYRALEDARCLDRAPSGVRQRLRSVYLQSATRNALLFRDTARAAAMLGRADIPLMLLKGAHLARFVYPEPALRSMADLDLMVPRDRLIEAEEIFLGNGYGPTPRPDPVEFCTRSNHLAKLSTPGGTVVELHWTIERPTSPFAIDLEGLWARALTVPFENQVVRVLAPEDLLLHLALHVSFHHGFDRSAVKALVDIRHVVDHHRDALDWNALVARANAWGAGGFTYVTLRLAGDLLGTPVPASVFDTLEHSPVDEEAMVAAQHFVLLPSTLPKVFVEVARRTGSDRWKWVLRRLFPTPMTMARLQGLPPGSLWVYPLYLVRLVGLLGRRGLLLLRAIMPGATRAGTLERESSRQHIEEWVRAHGHR